MPRSNVRHMHFPSLDVHVAVVVSFQASCLSASDGDYGVETWLRMDAGNVE